MLKENTKRFPIIEIVIKIGARGAIRTHEPLQERISHRTLLSQRTFPSLPGVPVDLESFAVDRAWLPSQLYD